MSSIAPSSHAPLQGLPGWLILLGALNAIGPLSIDMYLPGLPAIAAELQTDNGAVQRTLALFFVGLAVGQLFYGPFSDRFGRKPPLYVGLALFAGAGLGCAFADDVGSLTVWRFLQAMGGCAGMVISRAVVRDRCEPLAMARALSLLMLVMGVAPILAPMIGSAIMGIAGWRAIFVFLAAFGFVCLLAVMFGMRETHDRSTAAPLHLRHVLRNYGELLRDARFVRPAIGGGLAQAGMFAYIAGSPFVLIQLYGISADHFGWVFGTNALGLIAGSQINARLLRTVALPRLLRSALWALAAISVLSVAALLAGVSSLPFILASLFAFVATLGFIVPNSSALAMHHQAARAGTASALLGSLQFCMGTLSGLAISWWQRPDALPLIGVMAACGVGALLMVGTGEKRAGESSPA